MGTGRRPLALAFVALWLALAGNFAGTAHWLLVPHRLCEVHNRWEHGTGQESSIAAEPTRDPVYRSEGQAHDECPLSSFARIEPSLPELRSLAENVLPVERATELCDVAAERRCSVALLALAPKHSPPA